MLRSCCLLHDVIWRVWEALLLSQSLVVFCPCVSLLSKVMTAFASLIHPLVPTHDFRPHLTIYDQDLRAIEASLEKKLPGALLAGTNDPFIAEKLGGFVDILLIPALQSDERVVLRSVIEPFPGVSGLKKLLSDLEKKQKDPFSIFLQHGESRYEPFVDNWTEDIEKLILQHRSSQTKTIYTKNAFLHNHIATITCNFLSPFRVCIQQFKQEALKSLPRILSLPLPSRSLSHCEGAAGRNGRLARGGYDVSPPAVAQVSVSRRRSGRSDVPVRAFRAGGANGESAARGGEPRAGGSGGCVENYAGKGAADAIAAQGRAGKEDDL